MLIYGYVFVYIAILIESLGLFASLNLFCLSSLPSVIMMRCFSSKGFFCTSRAPWEVKLIVDTICDLKEWPVKTLSIDEVNFANSCDSALRCEAVRSTLCNVVLSSHPTWVSILLVFQ